MTSDVEVVGAADRLRRTHSRNPDVLTVVDRLAALIAERLDADTEARYQAAIADAQRERDEAVAKLAAAERARAKVQRDLDAVSPAVKEAVRRGRNPNWLTPEGKFDSRAYQRDLMRKRRAAARKVKERNAKRAAAMRAWRARKAAAAAVQAAPVVINSIS